ncbi:MAG: dUTP pyrophosphatase [Deltaproteobacteria bacterium]|nr:dUTP pyrophosphatase [Deltaproteobacteria bacterium]
MAMSVALSAPERPLTLQVSLAEGARAPARAHDSDAGLDVWVLRVEQRGPRLFFCDTGVTLAPPPGCYVEVAPRSSVVWRGFIFPHSVGVIDPGYRGPLLIPLLYVGAGGDEEAARAAAGLAGERVAQLLLRPLLLCAVEAVAREALPAPADLRAGGGFGSTGRA